MDKIQAMQEYGNLEGLLQVLRQPGDPAVRARAARALGQLGELEAADALTGAALNDPDAGVREAARLGLHDLLGDQAKLVLRLAESGGERDEGWLEPQDDQPADDEPAVPFDQSAGDAQPSITDYETLRGLIMIARGDPNPELRLRAVQALGAKTDLTAIRALAELALWDEDEKIHHAAERALAARFGEKMPEVLEAYREEALGEEDEFNEFPSYDSSASKQYTASPWETVPEQKEETASPIGCLLLVFLFLAGLYLILR